MKIRIQCDYKALFVSTFLKNHSVIGGGIANFTDMDCVDSGFTQQSGCRSW